MATARMLAGSEGETYALPYAAAVELFHNFTLIHDDIMDRDKLRRGVPTTHEVYGEAFAILAGDLAYALSYRAISYARNLGETPTNLAWAFSILTEAAVRISEGQAMDMMFEEKTVVDYHDYLKMIYLKTGALLEASAKLGVVAAAEELDQGWMPVLEAMGTYGKYVGLAFQIRDDILGVFGDPSKTGKPRYNDLIRGKKTLLVLYAYRHAEGEAKELVRRVLERKLTGDPEELEKIANIIRETGALSYAEDLARRFADEAVQIIDDIGEVEDEEAAEALKELARFVVEREK